MADIVLAFIDLLKADAEMTALAGEFVFGSELPPEVTKAMPLNAVVIRPSGGAAFAAGSTVELEAQRLDVVCYGTTPFEAAALRRRAGRVLVAVKRQVSAGVLVHWVQSAGGYLDGRDRDGAWPYAFQSFQTLFALDEVAG